MKKTSATTLCALWLWAGVLAPMTARAEGRAFEFSSKGSSVRLMERGTRERVRAFSDVTVTTEPGAHVWVVPLVLTGAGVVAGLGLCMWNEGRGCGKAILGGLVVGGAISLAYWAALACAEDEESCEEECSEDDEDCVEDEEPPAFRRAGLGLPRGARAIQLGLTPTVGFVNNRAVFGLGVRF